MSAEYCYVVADQSGALISEVAAGVIERFFGRYLGRFKVLTRDDSPEDGPANPLSGRPCPRRGRTGSADDFLSRPVAVRDPAAALGVATKDLCDGVAVGFELQPVRRRSRGRSRSCLE